MHKVKFAVAVKDALIGAKHYCDPDLKVPASGLEMPLQLIYSHLPRLTVMFSERPYLIAADANDGVRREPLRDAFWVETR
jgi:hypothetical protein